MYEERDGHLLNMLGAVIESSQIHIPMGGGGQGKKRQKDGPTGVPGWKEEVKRY